MPQRDTNVTLLRAWRCVIQPDREGSATQGGTWPTQVCLPKQMARRRVLCDALTRKGPQAQRKRRRKQVILEWELRCRADELPQMAT
jgi:hypothetical protein